MRKLFDLFYIFFKIGTFTLGGGPSMLPLIEKASVDDKKWLSKEEFVDMVALAQSIPGPIAVDTAVYIGYKVSGIPGSIAAVLGATISAFTPILIIAIYFTNISHNKNVEAIFSGIRPAIVALLAVPALNMGKTAKINKKTIIIPIITVILVSFFKVNAIYLIVLAGIGGLLYGLLIKRRT
ncbi:chromate transporter [Clostridium cellulovorans]|uniref:Chromate transporter n=1 Tax=Clostridium cellulovorans (strain ATCC 35296 / DSM 3052 / OCM 3 / 743B) TaxID=573061 RepID=D9SW92_CLOC7|nr:chromate transporter [Clostridium cellulovorans]ADL51236.1 Chromate transporter [Clostridium cellulovorans 743B]